MLTGAIAIHPALDPKGAALRAQVLAAARRRPAAPRTGRRTAGLALAAGASAAMAAIYVFSGGPANGAARPAAITAWIALGTLGLAVAATWFALPAPRSMLARPAVQLLAVALGVPLLIGAWLALWHCAYVDPFERFGWRCLGLTAATAPWPFAVLAFLSRRIDPVCPQLTGAALGGAAGAWAAVMVELWCPLAAAGHVLVGHVSPLLLLAGLGAACGERLFRLERVKLHGE